MKNAKRTFHILHKGKDYTEPYPASSFEDAYDQLQKQIKMMNPDFAVIISIIGKDLRSMKFEYYYTAPLPY